MGLETHIFCHAENALLDNETSVWRCVAKVQRYYSCVTLLNIFFRLQNADLF